MCQDCLFAIQGNYLESLPYPAASYFLGIETAGFEIAALRSQQGFFDEVRFARAWLAGEKKMLRNFVLLIYFKFDSEQSSCGVPNTSEARRSS